MDLELLERHFERELGEYKKKMTTLKEKTWRLKIEQMTRKMFKTKGGEEDARGYRRVQISRGETKVEMELFKKNEYALKCKMEQQFDSMYQTFTKDFVLLRHAKRQQKRRIGLK